MNATKMHHLGMKMGPTMEFGDPPRPYLDVAKRREGKPNCIPLLAATCNHRNQLDLAIHHCLQTPTKPQ